MIEEIFNKHLVNLIEGLSEFVKSKDEIECYPANFMEKRETFYPCRVYYDKNEDKCFVEYWEYAEHVGNKSMLHSEPMEDLTYQDLKHVFNCAKRFTTADYEKLQADYEKLQKKLYETLEREKVATKIINELRTRLNEINR